MNVQPKLPDSPNVHNVTNVAPGTSSSSTKQFKHIPSINQLSHYPLIGSIIGVGRIFTGGFEFLKGCLESLFKKDNILADKHITHGLKETGRGFIELVPVFGNLFAIGLDENKALRQALKCIKSGTSDDMLNAITILNDWGYEKSDSDIIRQLFSEGNVAAAFNYYNFLQDHSKFINGTTEYRHTESSKNDAAIADLLETWKRNLSKPDSLTNTSEAETKQYRELLEKLPKGLPLKIFNPLMDIFRYLELIDQLKVNKKN